MKKIKLLFAIVIFILILIPVLTFNYEKDYASDLDNRYLAEIDKESLKEDFSKTIEDYVNDRIGMREQLNASFLSINYHLFKHSDTFVVGKNGEAYTDIYGVEYDEVKKAFVNTIIKINKYCEERGTKVIFTMDPDKSYVYPEYLPDGVNLNNEWIDEMYSELEANGVDFVNNHELFLKLKDEHRLYNKLYDVIHYNAYGSKALLNNILKEIKKYYPVVNCKDVEELTEEQAKIKYYPNSKFIINEAIPHYSSSSKLITLDEKAKVKRNEFAQNMSHYVNEDSNLINAPKVLSFQGSHFYTSDYEKTIAENVKEFISIHNYHNLTNFEYFYNVYKPDVVIIDVSQHTITDYHFGLDEMNDMKLNPLLSQQNYEYEVDDSISIDMYDREEFVRLFVLNNVDFDNGYIIIGNNVFDLVTLFDLDGCDIYKDYIMGVENVKVVLTCNDKEINYYKDIEISQINIK